MSSRYGALPRASNKTWWISHLIQLGKSHHMLPHKGNVYHQQSSPHSLGLTLSYLKGHFAKQRQNLLLRVWCKYVKMSKMARNCLCVGICFNWNQQLISTGKCQQIPFHSDKARTWSYPSSLSASKNSQSMVWTKCGEITSRTELENKQELRLWANMFVLKQRIPGQSLICSCERIWVILR